MTDPNSITKSGFEAALAGDAGAVEAWLTARLTSDGRPAERRLMAAMRHAALAGGKRLRPFLVMETARLFGVAPADALPAAAALECVHCYSLVHDDLPAMDDDAMRRGQPTVHIAYDEATAILAGDALLTLAFEIVADPAFHADPAVRAGLALELARAAGHAGMVGGQALDLAAETVPVDDEAGIVAIQSKKTGALIRFGCVAGALLGAASPEDRDAVTAYAERLGLAFQIADDILDVEGSAAVLGKATAKDAAAGKATFVTLLGLDGARAQLAAETDAAIAALERFGARAAVLKEAARFVMTRQA
ncbi:MAG: polyprenyl synthetase family protein [Rhodobiaceae bacterium]|nr:polyprenyl synthetase family protein [Rhodobiaceae bacterium]